MDDKQNYFDNRIVAGKGMVPTEQEMIRVLEAAGYAVITPDDIAESMYVSGVCPWCGRANHTSPEEVRR